MLENHSSGTVRAVFVAGHQCRQRLAHLQAPVQDLLDRAQSRGTAVFKRGNAGRADQVVHPSAMSRLIQQEGHGHHGFARGTRGHQGAHPCVVNYDSHARECAAVRDI